MDDHCQSADQPETPRCPPLTVPTLRLSNQSALQKSAANNNNNNNNNSPNSTDLGFGDSVSNLADSTSTSNYLSVSFCDSSTDSLSESSVSLRFPRPQGSERLARWLAHREDSIMSPPGNISSPPVIISSFPVEEEADLLTESAFELVSNEDTESQNGLTPQLSLGTASQAGDDEVHSIAGSDSESATGDDLYERQTIPSQTDINKASDVTSRVISRSSIDLMEEDEPFDSTPQPSEFIIDYMAVANEAAEVGSRSSRVIAEEATSEITAIDEFDDDLDNPVVSYADIERTPRGSEYHDQVIVDSDSASPKYASKGTSTQEQGSKFMTRSSSFDYMEDSLEKPSTPEMSQILPGRPRMSFKDKALEFFQKKDVPSKEAMAKFISGTKMDWVLRAIGYIIVVSVACTLITFTWTLFLYLTMGVDPSTVLGLVPTPEVQISTVTHSVTSTPTVYLTTQNCEASFTSTPLLHPLQEWFKHHQPMVSQLQNQAEVLHQDMKEWSKEWSLKVNTCLHNPTGSDCPEITKAIKFYEDTWVTFKDQVSPVLIEKKKQVADSLLAAVAESRVGFSRAKVNSRTWWYNVTGRKRDAALYKARAKKYIDRQQKLWKKTRTSKDN